MESWQTQVVCNDIPPIGSVFDLKSGARARLADRSGSMVIIEVEKYRSDWIEWSEVKARIAASKLRSLMNAPLPPENWVPATATRSMMMKMFEKMPAIANPRPQLGRQ